MLIGIVDRAGLNDQQVPKVVKRAVERYGELKALKKAHAQRLGVADAGQPAHDQADTTWIDAPRLAYDPKEAEEIPVAFIGVWDTVGALGIPSYIGVPDVLGAIGKLGAFASGEKAEYYLVAEADVESTPLDPTDRVELKVGD